MTEKKSSGRTVLAWVDLETTGLDPETGRILEYAIVLTDLELNELSCMQGIIKQNPEEARALMDDFVTKMHASNGLLDEITAIGPGAGVGYENQVKICDTAIVTWLKEWQSTVSDGVDDVIFVIAGSTISFDKSYIKKHMPLFFKMLHYRQLDVSSYKVGFPGLFGTATSDAHRAMSDIRDSIEMHRTMRDFVFDGISHRMMLHGNKT